MAKQIVIYGTNDSKQAYYPVTSKDGYECANAHITRGTTSAPNTLDECFQKFPGVLDIATAVGFFVNIEGSSGSSGWSGYTLWTGETGITDLNVTKAQDVYFDSPVEECDQISGSTALGLEWLGCLWGTPSAPYSCTCPDIQPKYEAYIKLRLNVASFWATPVETPVKRAEFVDSIRYGKKIDVTIAGDFNIKIGQVVSIRANALSGFPYSPLQSYMNGYYYITGVKHVIMNSGTHESALALTQIPEDYTGITQGVPYYP